MSQATSSGRQWSEKSPTGMRSSLRWMQVWSVLDRVKEGDHLSHRGHTTWYSHEWVKAFAHHAHFKSDYFKVTVLLAEPPRLLRTVMFCGLVGHEKSAR
jgi:hypothetical protein